MVQGAKKKPNRLIRFTKCQKSNRTAPRTPLIRNDGRIEIGDWIFFLYPSCFSLRDERDWGANYSGEIRMELKIFILKKLCLYDTFFRLNLSVSLWNSNNLRKHNDYIFQSLNFPNCPLREHNDYSLYVILNCCF